MCAGRFCQKLAKDSINISSFCHCERSEAISCVFSFACQIALVVALHQDDIEMCLCRRYGVLITFAFERGDVEFGAVYRVGAVTRGGDDLTELFGAAIARGK